MSESQTKAGNQECFEKLEKLSLSLLSLLSQLSLSHSLSLDMLNNFCFHVYSQKSLIIGENGNDLFLHHHPLLLLQSSQSWIPANNCSGKILFSFVPYMVLPILGSFLFACRRLNQWLKPHFMRCMSFDGQFCIIKCLKLHTYMTTKTVALTRFCQDCG